VKTATALSQFLMRVSVLTKPSHVSCTAEKRLYFGENAANGSWTLLSNGSVRFDLDD
jgi:hypothetical protein